MGISLTFGSTFYLIASVRLRSRRRFPVTGAVRTLSYRPPARTDISRPQPRSPAVKMPTQQTAAAHSRVTARFRSSAVANSATAAR
jgi:hypothetical protein